jgi:NADH dehydrogenase
MVVKEIADRGPKDILILGAGVSGLRVALNLEKKLNKELGRIVLIDENSYHQYLYRIHEVCGLNYEEKDIIVPISRLIEDKNIEFRQMKVEGIDPERRVVETSEGQQPFDILVAALGSHTAYYGIEGLEEHSLVLSSFEAAKKIRQVIEELFASAKGTGRTPQIVIGGGGFTGTELAGELTDWLPVLINRYGLPKPENLAKLVEALPTILPGWPGDLTKRAQEVLSSRGIDVLLGDPVSRVLEDRLVLKSGQEIESDLTIWTGGVTCDPVCVSDFRTMSRRICIDDYCRAEGYEDIFVAGDTACAMEAKTGRPMPPTAHIAMVQADVVAHNIHASLTKREMKRYIGDRAGEIVTLGKTNAIGELFGIKFSGVPAKIMKRIVHWWYVRSIGGFSLLLGL